MMRKQQHTFYIGGASILPENAVISARFMVCQPHSDAGIPGITKRHAGLLGLNEQEL